MQGFENHLALVPQFIAGYGRQEWGRVEKTTVRADRFHIRYGGKKSLTVRLREGGIIGSPAFFQGVASGG